MPTELARLTSMTRMYVRLSLTLLVHGFRHRVLRWGGATRCHRGVWNNPGLCGDLVSVGSVGTSYTGGIGGTALGTACGAFTPPRVPPESLRL
jgi:hypothetical protein